MLDYKDIIIKHYALHMSGKKDCRSYWCEQIRSQ